ncbi:murein biosynthesis integral membrane protein MurJ [Facilibium subflavum]|uniref:murein biosynthesis integral membrane protein MurJ n=1 Tax=Facilibium subflavum TaxID=2219058 RepID=UPI000E64C97F|nr:murein biosynthesis integral membrane protein MurJ [Facilibium subflavum]
MIKKKNSKQTTTLAKPGIFVALFTLISRILGFIRDMLFAKYFGASATMEAFLVAFRVPNFIRRLFVEGAITQALTPSFVHLQDKPKRQNLILRQLISYIGGFTLLLSVLGMIFSSLWVLLFAPGFYDDPMRLNLAKNLLAIMFPYIFLMSLTAVFAALLNSLQRFNLPALTPVILNVCMISFICFSSKFSIPIYAVAMSVLIAGILQCCFHIYALWRLGFHLTPVIKWPIKTVKRILKRILPAIFGASIIQISLLIETVFASFLTTGSLSWLYYPDRLNQFPLGIFGLTLSTIILPSLSKYKRQATHFNHTLNWAIKWVFLLSVPATFAMCVLSSAILITLFHYGAFSLFDVMQSQRALIAFSIGLSAFVLIKVFISALYAYGITKPVVKIGALCLLFNIISNLILVYFLKAYSLGYLALAISTTLTAILNAAGLYLLLHRKYHFHVNKQLVTFILRILLASIVMAVILYVCKGDISDWLKLSFFKRISWLAGLVILGLISYGALLWLLRVKQQDMALHKNDTI